MNLNIAICDDDKDFLITLDRFITSYNYNSNDINLVCDTYSSADKLISAIKSETKYQLFFLDIEMPSINGLDLAKKIKADIKHSVYIVFISSYPQYMSDSFSVHPYYYLQKPVTSDQISKILEELTDDIKKTFNLFTVISSDYTEYIINIHEILYITTSGKKSQNVTFHFCSKEIETKGPLMEWEKTFKDYSFLLCHRGILVNLEHIHYIKDGRLIMDTNESIPTSRSFIKLIRSELLNQIIRTKK